jgi:hypothetical protein
VTSAGTASKVSLTWAWARTPPVNAGETDVTRTGLFINTDLPKGREAQRVLKHSWYAVVVFRRYDNDAIAVTDGISKAPNLLRCLRAILVLIRERKLGLDDFERHRRRQPIAQSQQCRFGKGRLAQAPRQPDKPG